MIRDKPFYPVLYMFVITAFFSSIVIGVSRFTKERVLANQKRSFEQAVLNVLPRMYDTQASDLELHRRFQNRITAPDESPAHRAVRRILRHQSIKGRCLRGSSTAAPPLPVPTGIVRRGIASGLRPAFRADPRPASSFR